MALDAAIEEVREVELFHPENLRASFAKPDGNLTVYQNPERRMRRSHESDRRFPLESVSLDSYNQKHGSDLSKATIHIGPAANDYTSSLHALAVALGTDIYFRNGAYKPETEEGKATLAHELTLAAQYAENRITDGVSEEALEREAELAETRETGNTDSADRYVTINLNGQYFTMLESEMQSFADSVADGIIEWVEVQKTILGEKEYFQLLVGLEDWAMGDC